MPYINQDRRRILDSDIDALTSLVKNNPFKENDGELNYIITRIIDAVYGEGGYDKFNRAMGVLDCVSREFYRRKVAPYEDKKIKENGDVYGV